MFEERVCSKKCLKNKKTYADATIRKLHIFSPQSPPPLCFKKARRTQRHCCCGVRRIKTLGLLQTVVKICTKRLSLCTFLVLARLDSIAAENIAVSIFVKNLSLRHNLHLELFCYDTALSKTYPFFRRYWSSGPLTRTKPELFIRVTVLGR